jgi:hypothetical protein
MIFPLAIPVNKKSFKIGHGRLNGELRSFDDYYCAHEGKPALVYSTMDPTKNIRSISKIS